MTAPPDPRVLFAAERTLLAWQRSSIALMGFGFVIERFNLFLSALQHTPQDPAHHLFSALVGVLLILLGATVAFTSSISYRRFVNTLSSEVIPAGYPVKFGSAINLAVAAAGIALATYLLVTTFQAWSA
jgi:putative membrane protein